MADETTVFNHFPQITEALEKAVKAAVAKAALDIEGHAKLAAPVDTGYLKSSIYAVTSASSDYNGGGGGKSLPEVPAPADEYTAFVAVGAAYGAFVEYGTSRMGAQPYLTPAAEAVDATLANDVASAIAEAMSHL